MKRGTQTYTTKSGYTYQYIPDDIDLDSEHLQAILEAAVKCKAMGSITVTKNLFDYLSKKYHFTKGTEPHSDSCNDYKAIWKNTEHYLNIFHNENTGFYTIWVLRGKFYKKLNPKENISRKGLHELIDPNYGGIMTEEALSAASLIIFG